MDIAIVGIAGRFPDAKNIDELYLNLKNGKDSVREISQERIKSTTLNPNEKYYICGYLEDIDKFDHKLFKVSMGEAQTMSPIQRQLLEVVYETFESSGYSIEHFNGSNTAIFVGASPSDYYEHADSFVPTLISGNSDAYLPAVIARQYNLTGNAQLINTACSSSLAVVHNACSELILGNADYALACGANIYIFPYSKIPYSEDDQMNLDSPDGKSKAFSSEANGMSYGESVSSILLKPLDKAIMDKDIIYAVIKSSIINNNAGRSDSVKAVDSIAQSELLKRAWVKACIKPEDIGYIEAHGSGTQLGDALEIEGINLAFREHTQKKKICPVSTIKSNIGHTRMAAGITGLVRAVLSLKNKILFPTTNFKYSSPLIDFENSAVFINEDFREWTTDYNVIRYAGVTSLGESGINCHVVLSEAPAIDKDNETIEVTPYLVTVSSATQVGLVKNLTELKNKILNEERVNLQDISYTLNTGRKHYEQRFAVVTDNVEELIERIDYFINIHQKDTNTYKELKKLILIFSDHVIIPEDLLNFFISKYITFKQHYEECQKLCNNRNNNFKNFAFQYSLYKLLEEYGISTDSILCIGIGEIVYSVIMKEISLEQGLQMALSYKYEEIDSIDESIKCLIEQEAKEEPVAFIELGPRSIISTKLKELSTEIEGISVLHLTDKTYNKDPFQQLVKSLYLAQYNVDWNKFQKHYGGRKIELPHYQFEKVRCWLREKPREVRNDFKSTSLDHVRIIIEENITELEHKIATYWQDVLGVGKISINDDFFEIGGDSLKATLIINRITKGIGVNVSFEDMFDYPTIKLLAEYISGFLETEQRLSMFWKQVLKVDNISSEDNFFELGGHSLLASQILIKVKREFCLSLNFEDIFEHPTLKEFSDLINDQLSKGIGGVDDKEIEPVGKKEYYYLSPAQNRMFILEQLQNTSLSYNISGAAKIEGILNKEKFEDAFSKLVKRHEALRTSFEMINGKPMQKIHEDVELPIEYIEACKGELSSIIKDFIRLFDLSEAPLFRVKLITLAPNVHILAYDMHHILSDGTSMGILMEEYSRLYNGEELKPLRIQYKDFSEWQNNLIEQGKLKSQEEYWLDVFKGEIPVLNMPTDYPRPSIQSFEGDNIKFILDKDITSKINAFAKETSSTLYMILLSAYNILLSKYSGQEDIVIGSPIAGRHYADLENIIGMFVNTLAIRNRPEGEKSFSEFLKEVKVNSLMAYENQNYQFEELVENLDLKRDLSRNPIFDVMFVLQNEGPRNMVSMLDAKVIPYEVEGATSKFDILLNVVEEGNELHLTFEYCTKLFKRGTIERMLSHLVNILRIVTENPRQKIKDINILTEKEKDTILFSLNNTKENYPMDKTIHQLFEEQVEKTPNNFAVVFKEKQLTYRDLNEKSNQLARVLRDKGVLGNIVAIMLERSVEMVVGIMGILKAGGAYLPIDPNYPEDRINFMIEDSNAGVLLIDEFSMVKASTFRGEIINLSEDSIYDCEKTNLENLSRAEDLLYLIYTSGTTGNPKGVMLTNRNLVNLMYYQFTRTNINFTKKVLQFTTISFDVCYQELFSTLLCGGELYIVEEDIKKDVRKLFSYVEKNSISVVFLPTAYLKYIMSENDYISCIPENIEHLITAGEQLVINQQSKRILAKKGMYLHNHYGPSETHVVTTYTVGRNDIPELPPIGRPISNTSIYILDKYMKLQPIGVPGELYISGDNVGKGYFNRSELTAEKYVSNPFVEQLNSSHLLMPHSPIIYKTGDIAKWLPDGNIEFLGRIDHQVKIRGYRIELGEIESHILKHNEIKEVIVQVREDKGRDKFLCAYIVSDKEVNIREVRDYLSNTLPDYMIPSYFVQLDSLPLTPNGKIDRKSLPEPDGNMDIGTEFTVSKNETEEKLVKIWQEVLGLEKIGTNDNFFDLGGHSLKAMVLVSRIHKEFNIEIHLRQIFTAPTIKELANLMTGAKQFIYLSLEQVKSKVYYALSSSQKRMYILSQMEGASASYNISSAVQIEGSISKKSFNDAFDKIINRHDAFRTSFEMIDGEPVQKIHNTIKFNVEYIEADEEELPKILKEFVRPFNLDTAPLLRVKLITLNQNRHILISDMHHIISDGVSMKILVEEFVKIYNGKELKPLRLQYKDYSEWQNRQMESKEIKRQEEYWLEVFKDEIPVLDMPTDYTRPSVQSFEGASYKFEINEEVTSKLQQLASKKNTTMFMNLLAAYNVLLSKITGQDDIIVGLPVAGRNHADLQNVIGVFLNTLALRNRPKADKTFALFLEEVRENSLKAYENQDYPFEMLLEKLEIKRDTSRTPLFDIVFNSQDTNIIGNNFEENEQSIKFKPYSFERNTSTFDIIFFLHDYGNKVVIECDYRSSLFKKSTIEYMMGEYIKLLEDISKNPYKQIKDYRVFSRKSLQATANKISPNIEFQEFTKSEATTTIIKRFEKQVEKYTRSIAVKVGDYELTYNELNKNANRIAKSILKNLQGNNCNNIAMLFEHGVGMIEGMLGILKAGKTYVPLDPAYPIERLLYMVEDCEASIILTNSNSMDVAQKLQIKSIIDIINIDTLGVNALDENLDLEIDIEKIAYIIYTSGSTGKPKGVMHSHKNALNNVRIYTNELHLNSLDKIALFTSYSHSVAVLDIFSSLLNGATIYPYNLKSEGNMENIAGWLKEEKITIYHSIPQVYRYCINKLNEGEKLSEIRLILLGGEAVFKKDVDLYKKYFTEDCLLVNFLGASEIQVGTLYFLDKNTELAGTTVPVGYSVEGVEVYLLNENYEETSVYAIGEIVYKSDYLAKGYWNKDGKTNEVFIRDPVKGDGVVYRSGDLGRLLSNGEIEFLGRKDFQVKIRGYRIELGEIESRLLKREDIKEVVVTSFEDENNEKYLCAYLVGEKEINFQQVLNYLSKELPDYMIPSHFIQIDNMPLTPNGKVDRRDLPKPSKNINTSFEHVPPENSSEEILSRICKELLGVKEISVNESFFRIGGHSLKAVEFAEKIREQFGVNIKLRHIFEKPTIRSIAEYIEELKNVG